MYIRHLYIDTDIGMCKLSLVTLPTYSCPIFLLLYQKLPLPSFCLEPILFWQKSPCYYINGHFAICESTYKLKFMPLTFSKTFYICLSGYHWLLFLFFFFLVLLRHNWHTALYKLKVYTIMILFPYVVKWLPQ